MKFLLIISIFIINLYSNEQCGVDDRIMYSIAEVEKHKNRPVGYPYIISLNKKSDYKLASKYFGNYFMDNRTLDCLDSKTCVMILNKLISNKITNLDLGGYQLNYIYWKIDKFDYFDMQESYLKACSIVKSHNKDNWSWNKIANYHSGTKKYNEKYKQLLIASIKRNMSK